MARSRGKEVSILNELFGLLVIVPIWVGPILVPCAYAGFRWVFPWLLRPSADEVLGPDLMRSVLADFSVMLAPWAGGVVLVIWVAAEIRKLLDRRRLDSQESIESIRDLDWKEFERLLAEAFRRLGFTVEQLGGSGPDGGVDLRMTREGETALVQCKHWKSRKVGVQVVRELLGVMTSEQANIGFVVTSGAFTPDAEEFARDNPVQLIGADQLNQMIQAVRTAPAAETPARSAAEHTPGPSCPKCSSPMVLRTARKGANTGPQFWGCSRFPECRGTMDKAAS